MRLIIIAYKKNTMNSPENSTPEKSKLTPYRLPASIVVFFISYALLTRTALFYIASATSSLIADFFPVFNATKEAEQIVLIYAILLSVIAYFAFGKLMKIDAQENNKRLLKNLAFVAAIAIAYVYSIVQ